VQLLLERDTVEAEDIHTCFAGVPATIMFSPANATQSPAIA
jgi:hypothetical protein